MNFDRIKTPDEMAHDIADNLRSYRRSRKISMKELATRSGVSFASVRRFEKTGQISLDSLLRIALVLDQTSVLEGLFKGEEIKSIEDIINGKV